MHIHIIPADMAVVEAQRMAVRTGRILQVNGKHTIVAPVVLPGYVKVRSAVKRG
jgi:hypothetical protein